MAHKIGIGFTYGADVMLADKIRLESSPVLPVNCGVEVSQPQGYRKTDIRFLICESRNPAKGSQRFCFICSSHKR
ncbi:hypothetical protein HerbRD11066_42680 [Herbidospora sp. RD11066]